jgi:hypothetical protein
MTNQEINDVEQLWDRYFKHRDEETRVSWYYIIFT